MKVRKTSSKFYQKMEDYYARKEGNYIKKSGE